MPRRPSGHVDSAAAVGKRLRKARKAAGLTQRDLSFPGATVGYISHIESGARVPSYQVLREFASRLGVSADYLATGAAEAKEEDPLFEAELALRLGDEHRARELYEQIRNSDAAPSAISRAEIGLGQLALQHGEIPEAITLLEQALTEPHLRHTDAALAGNTLGRAYVAQGRFDEALAIFKRFLEEAHSHNDDFDILRFSLLLANTYVDAGNYSQAQQVLADAIGQARKIVDPMLQAALYWSQSRLHSSQGQTDLAAEYGQMAISVLKASEHTLEAARAILLLAHIENDRGNPQTALELIEEAEPAVEASGVEADEGMVTVERARALDALGEPEQAASLMLGAISKLTDASPVSAARAYAAAAQFFRTRGDQAKALELYELAAERLQAPDRHLADVLTAMSDIYEEQGRPEQALQLLREAMRARSGTHSRF